MLGQKSYTIIKWVYGCQRLSSISIKKDYGYENNFDYVDVDDSDDND